MASVIIGDYEYTLFFRDGSRPCASAKVVDTTKSSYGELQSTIIQGHLTYTLVDLVACFINCTNLTVAPDIPTTVTDMGSCFTNCTSLTNAPVIPLGVTSMSNCFRGCILLRTSPEIPASVTNLYQCFAGCTSLRTPPAKLSNVQYIGSCFHSCQSLTGTIEIDNSPIGYSQCFYLTRQPIVLNYNNASYREVIQHIAETSQNNNVSIAYIGTNPLPTAIITAIRVTTDDPTDPESTNPNENGLYAYVTVRTTVFTDQASDNVAQAPIITLDGSAYTPLNPSGTAIYTCWVNLGNEQKHIIGATPRDLYKSGIEITFTLASTYSPMEFYQGGTGASFGKHATQAGVLDAAWDIHTDGEYTITDTTGTTLNGDPLIRNIFDAIYPVGSIYMSTETGINGDPRIAAFIPNSQWERVTGRVLLGATDTGGTGGNSTASVRAGYTGGEATHKLTTAELASHTHDMQNHTHTTNIGSHTHEVQQASNTNTNIFDTGFEKTGYGLTQTAGFANRVLIRVNNNTTHQWRFMSKSTTIGNKTSGAPSNNTTTSTGSDTAHNNMPPYLSVYIWKRTA